MSFIDLFKSRKNRERPDHKKPFVETAFADGELEGDELAVLATAQRGTPKADKHYTGIQKQSYSQRRVECLEDWLSNQYEPAIQYYNESDRYDPLFHLLVDFGEMYKSIQYNNEIKKKFGVSKDEFDSISKEVFDGYFHSYSMNLNYSGLYKNFIES